MLPRHILFDFHNRQQEVGEEKLLCAKRTAQVTCSASKVAAAGSYVRTNHLGGYERLGAVSIAAVGSTDLRGAYCATVLLAPDTQR